jgi:phosphate transport system protein
MSEMPQELRVGFRRELANMEMLVEQLFGYVVEGIPGATDALLTGDAGSVRALHEREKVIDAVWKSLEAKVNELLLREAPVAGDLRYLLTVVRVVPELERSGDLAQHIAVRGTKGLADQLSPRARGIVTRMGDVAGAMWRDLASAWSSRQLEDVDHLDDVDEELDELHASLVAEVASTATSTSVAMEMALVARFYERLGDHAVNIARRLAYLAGGWQPRQSEA